MVRLELTEEERSEAARILRRYEAALSVELRHTDHREFKDLLRSRAATVEQLLRKLEVAAPV